MFDGFVMSYSFYHLRDLSSSNSRRLLSVTAEKCTHRAKNWGMFPGLFGLRTNEIYWLTDYKDDSPFRPGEGVEVIDKLTLKPTVRPKEFAERTQPGIYVFRWFEVAEEKIDEVVRLSNEAWKSFEGGFDTEVQGLFRVEGHSRYSMVLVTWYKDLSVWQDSREPAPEARQNFLARQELLDSACPIATRLELP